jgi:molybdopterin synthase sulfur carrier subunit
MRRGAIRDHLTHQRRPFVRFFACAEELSHEPDAPACGGSHAP